MADFQDKAQNKAEDLKGKAKEAYGEAADDKQAENEGKGEQAKADFKDKIQDVGDKAKDKANEVIGKFKDNK